MEGNFEGFTAPRIIIFKKKKNIFFLFNHNIIVWINPAPNSFLGMGIIGFLLFCGEVVFYIFDIASRPDCTIPLKPIF